jgi:formate dehydrogenase subunit delta
MSPDKLGYMANQIGKFFASRPHDEAVAAIANHLEKFWDPRMRRTIVQHVEAKTLQLDPLVQEAVEQLRVAQQS